MGAAEPAAFVFDDARVPGGAVAERFAQADRDLQPPRDKAQTALSGKNHTLMSTHNKIGTVASVTGSRRVDRMRTCRRS